MGEADDGSIDALLDAVERLGPAIETRAVIEQAKGLLMAQTRCTAGEAFALIVTASQQQQRKIVQVAVEIRDRVAATGRLPDSLVSNTVDHADSESTGAEGP